MSVLKKYRLNLLGNLTRCLGISLLIISPYFLEKVSSNSYFSFEIYRDFLIPQIQSALGLTALIYIINNISINYRFKPNWFLIFIDSLFLILILRGLLSLLGFTPQSLAEIIEVFSPNWVDHATIKRLGLALLLIFALFTIRLIGKCNKASILRFCSAFGWSLGGLSAFHAISLISIDLDFLKIRESAMLNNPYSLNSKKRVVWVIFDEFDYSRVFLHRNILLELPNLDRLKKESISSINAVSPASATLISIPSLITGRHLISAEPNGPGKLVLHEKNGTYTQWGSEANLFDFVNAAGGEVAILGFYHPYCNIFPYASPCSSQSVFAYPNWWWGIFQGLRTFPGFDLVAEEYSWYDSGFNLTTQRQLNALDSYISSRSNSLTFIHFNFPHLPGSRIGNKPKTKIDNLLPGYEQNILLVDQTVGDIVEALEKQSKSRDILLIISSDHWLRAKQNSKNMSPDKTKLEFGDNITETHLIPLFIRHMSEKTPYTISKPINTIHTAQLIEDFLTGRITNHAEITKWWLSKSYFSPMIQPEKNN